MGARTHGESLPVQKALHSWSLFFVEHKDDDAVCPRGVVLAQELQEPVVTSGWVNDLHVLQGYGSSKGPELVGVPKLGQGASFKRRQLPSLSDVHVFHESHCHGPHVRSLLVCKNPACLQMQASSAMAPEKRIHMH
eukprot:1161479-Pelagomonas_calceolata.AAC.12